MMQRGRSLRGVALAGLALAAGLAWAVPLRAAETVRVGGTGVGLAFARAVGEQLRAADPTLQTEVLPSLGTPGGIKALAAGDIDVAIATRTPNPDESAGGLRAAACLTTALIFATSRPSAPGIELAKLPAIYGDTSPRWPDGQPLKIIMRAKGGTENPYLVKLVPELAAAFANAYARPGVPVGATDQENADLAHRTAGSFAIMSLLQVQSEKVPVTPLAVDGVMPGPATIADRSYPMPLPVCFLLAGKPSSGAARFAEFLRSDAGRDLARQFGAAPSE